MSEENMINELVEALEGASSFMWGMQFDPSLGAEQKEALAIKAEEIDKLTEQYT